MRGDWVVVDVKVVVLVGVELVMSRLLVALGGIHVLLVY